MVAALILTNQYHYAVRRVHEGILLQGTVSSKLHFNTSIMISMHLVSRPALRGLVQSSLIRVLFLGVMLAAMVPATLRAQVTLAQLSAVSRTSASPVSPGAEPQF
jgi:hypothetical protein